MTRIFALKRVNNDRLSTIGQLFDAPGGDRLCVVLEPGPSTPLHPRIAAGTWPMRKRVVGGFYERYRARFGAAFLPFMIEFEVPGRQFILFHCGNTPEQTLGCLMAGNIALRPSETEDGHWGVSGSELAFRRVYPVLRDAMLSEECALQVNDEPPAAVA